MPEGAKPGDVLLLTKALGTQVRLMKRPWAGHQGKIEKKALDTQVGTTINHVPSRQEQIGESDRTLSF